MDINVIASAAVVLLRPYFAKGAEEFAKATGKVAAEKVGTLYQAIKGKFKEDIYAKQTLTRAKEQPTSKTRQAALENLLVEVMKKDAAFTKVVHRLVQEDHASDVNSIQIANGSYIAQADRDSTATVNINRPKE